MQEIATINSQRQPSAFISTGNSVLALKPIEKMDERINPIFPPTFKSGKGLTKDEREFLKFKIAETKSLISKPASEATINRVAVKFSASKAMAGNIIAESFAEDYHEVLEGVPEIILATAYKKIRRGDFDGSTKFVPDAADVYKVCCKVLEATQTVLKSYERLLKMPEDKPRILVSSERMAEIEAEMKKAGAQ